MTTAVGDQPIDSRPGRLGESVRSFLARVGSAIGVVLALVVVTFGMVHLIPGDPVRGALGPGAPPEHVSEVRTQLGLDKPLVSQFASYFGGLLRGDLGQSLETREPVSALIADRLFTTLTVAGIAVCLVTVVAITVGMAVAIAARRGHRWIDATFLGVTSLGGAIPEYVAGTLLVLLFAIWWDVLPVAGVHGAHGYVLPVVAISLGPISALARVVRRETAVVLESPYVRTARSKQLSLARTYLLHVLPNVTSAALTYSGLLLVGLLGGTVIVESVFSLPGLGTAMVSAVQRRDYPVIQGIVLVLGAMAVAITFCLDMLVGLVDPRVRRRVGE